MKDVEPKSAIRILGELKGEGAGIGRLVSLSGGVPVSIGGLATRMKAFLNLQHGMLSNAIPYRVTLIFPIIRISSSGSRQRRIVRLYHQLGRYMRWIRRVCH